MLLYGRRYFGLRLFVLALFFQLKTKLLHSSLVNTTNRPHRAFGIGRCLPNGFWRTLSAGIPNVPCDKKEPVGEI